MEWIEISVSVHREAVEATCAILMDAGAIGVAMEDPALLFERSEQPGDWDYVEIPEGVDRFGEIIVKAWLQRNAWFADSFQQIKAEVQKLSSYGILAGSCTILSEIVEDGEWATAWKAYYKPIRVGKRLLIRPIWEEMNLQPQDIEIALDPGLAFGTGSHPTTQLCLRFLEDYLKPGDSFLDVGCGSGILTIAAAKLGAGVLSAVDIDELAVHSTIENLKLNGLAEKVRVIHGDLVEQIQEPVRVVTANIVADAILRLLPNIEPLLVSQGLFIASGIITTREEDLVKATEEAGLSILEVRREGDWVAILAQKPL